MEAETQNTQQVRQLKTEAQALLLQGKFSECFDVCQTFFAPSQLGLDPDQQISVSYDPRQSAEDKAADETTEHLDICLIFLQCLYELHEANGFNEEVEDKVSVGQNQVESFLRQKSPVPFTVVVTWIQLLIQLGVLDKAKQVLTACLDDLAKEVHLSQSPSIDKCDKYAILANLYAVHTLPKLGQWQNAKRFLAMHKTGTLLSQSQILGMVKSLEEMSPAKGEDGLQEIQEKTDSERPGGSEQNRASGSSGVNGSSGVATVETAQESSNSETIQPEKRPGEIVLTVEEAAGISVGVVILGILVAKRHSLRSLFQTNINSIGDKIFGP